MKVLIVVIVFLSVFTASWAGAGKRGATAARRDATACQHINSHGSSIGSGDVINGQAYDNGSSLTGDGNTLRSNDLVCTDSSGLFHFNVTVLRKRLSCMVKSNSALRLGPRYGWLASYRAGISRCRINGGAKRWLRTPHAYIRTGDPLFSVAMTRNATTLIVRQGLMRVTGVKGFEPLTGAGATVVVGPGQTTTVHGGAPPGPPVPAPPPSADEQHDYSQLGSEKAAFARPDAAGSPGLTEILSKRMALAWGFDSKLQADQGTAHFVNDFLGTLATAWKISLDKPVLASETEALKLMSGHDIDLYVTPETTVADFAYVPLFLDSRQKTWYLAIFAGDHPYYNALANLIFQIVETGQYDAFYKDSFGHRPGSYQIFAPLFGS